MGMIDTGITSSGGIATIDFTAGGGIVANAW
jgi:hypothetical protein